MFSVVTPPVNGLLGTVDLSQFCMESKTDRKPFCVAGTSRPVIMTAGPTWGSVGRRGGEVKG